jgi:hypothetical protein
MKQSHGLQIWSRKTGKRFFFTSLALMVLMLCAIGNTGNAQVNAPSYNVVSKTYVDRAISINYPQISNMNDIEKQDRLNQLIQTEALSLLNDYEANELDKLTVKMDYVVGRHNAELFSIRWTGSRYLKGTPYPTGLFQSLNLDMQTGSKLRLQDVVLVNAELVEAIKKGRIQAAKDITSEQLRLENGKMLKSFAQADSTVSTENPARAFSYFTADGMGVSLAVIHALGDHVEFELLMEKLTPFIKPAKATVIK